MLVFTSFTSSFTSSLAGSSAFGASSVLTSSTGVASVSTVLASSTGASTFSSTTGSSSIVAFTVISLSSILAPICSLVLAALPTLSLK